MKKGEDECMAARVSVSNGIFSVGNQVARVLTLALEPLPLRLTV
jgi:hypothetical protein